MISILDLSTTQLQILNLLRSSTRRKSSIFSLKSRGLFSEKAPTPSRWPWRPFRRPSHFIEIFSASATGRVCPLHSGRSDSHARHRHGEQPWMGLHNCCSHRAHFPIMKIPIGLLLIPGFCKTWRSLRGSQSYEKSDGFSKNYIVVRLFWKSTIQL
jgi:hypothetical protein